MISAQKLGWIAGVLDMKGRMKVVNTKGRSSQILMLYVETSQLNVIQELERLTGTNAQYREMSRPSLWNRKGCVEHCPHPHVHVEAHDPTIPKSGRWHITGVGAAIILYNLRDLIVYQEGIAQFIAWVIETAPKSGRGRHAVYQSVERLRGLGWQIPLEFDIVIDDDEEAETVKE